MFSLRSFIASRFTPVSETFVPHFIPLDLEAIKNTIDSVTEDPFNVTVKGAEPLRPRLKEFLSSIRGFANSVPHKILLKPGQVKVLKGPKDPSVGELLQNYTPAAVYFGAISDDNLLGLLYSDINMAQAQLFDKFLNEKLSKLISKSVIFSAGLTGTGKVQQSETLGIFARLSKAFNNPVVVNGTTVSSDNAALKRRAMLLQSVMTEYSRTQKFNTRADAKVTKELTQFVNSIRAEITLIQAGDSVDSIESGLRNQGIGLAEENFGGSSLLDDITSFLGRVFSSGTDSKREFVRLEKAKPLRVKLTEKLKSIFAPRKTTVAANTLDGTVIQGQAQLTNLSSLEEFFNRNLHDSVRDNMGIGGEEGVLNYRTGRFARSARVTAISMDRQSNISAFYTYQRFPYGTFASGGAQHIPSMPDRDPVNIIQGAIRDLARQKAIARLKTVLV